MIYWKPVFIRNNIISWITRDTMAHGDWFSWSGCEIRYQRHLWTGLHRKILATVRLSWKFLSCKLRLICSIIQDNFITHYLKSKICVYMYFILYKMTGTGLTQMITTHDPKLTALGLLQYPPLPGNTDPAKIEEIRRTVYVGNLAKNVSIHQYDILLYFYRFNTAVAKIRILIYLMVKYNFLE